MADRNASGIAPCTDCGIDVPEAEQRFLDHMYDPYCRPCWLTYPTEEELANGC